MFVKSDEVHSEPRSKKAKRAILEYLEERKKVRATELKKEVCDHVLPLSRICSKKIFYRCLSELVESKLVIRNERSRKNVTYSNRGWVDYEDRVATDKIRQATTVVKLLAKVEPQQTGGMNLFLLETAFINIIDMYAGLALGKMLQKKTSAEIANILETTIPELLERFESTLEKCGKNKSTLLSSLISYEEKFLGFNRGVEEKMPKLIFPGQPKQA